MMASSRCLSLVLTMLALMAGLHHISGGTWELNAIINFIYVVKLVKFTVCFVEKEVTLNAVTNKLKFEEKDIDSRTSYDLAVDGKTSQIWEDCAISQSSTPTIWLSIDLLHLYSVTKIRFLTRDKYGIGIEVYVGKDAIDSDGITNHRCGSGVTIPNPPTFTEFSCSPINWVQHVSIRRTGYQDIGSSQYLQVCEVEVYYDETEGRNLTRTRLANYFLFT